MGLLYKGFQSLSYYGLEKARERGIEVDKERQRERTNKLYKEARSMVDYDSLDKHWDNFLQECWDRKEDESKRKSRIG